MATSTPRDALPDHASHHDDRALDIDRVGIKDILYPITVWDRANQLQHTNGRISLTVSLPRQFKGTHMSRFVEILHARRGDMSSEKLPALLAEIQDKLDADDAQVHVAFPYFIEKQAPVSRVPSLMDYPCTFSATQHGAVFDFVLGVQVPVKSLCPCSKAVSDRGAHNQRSLVNVELRGTSHVWIEQVVEAVESCASAPLYALLKREDEKFITEHAYDHPKFVEDLVRDVVIAVRAIEGVTWLRVRAENLESIHNHSAYAEITWTG